MEITNGKKLARVTSAQIFYSQQVLDAESWNMNLL
jgi:hypothetical protein